MGETLCDVYKGVGCGKQRPVVDFKEGVRFRGEGEGEGGPLLVVGTRRLYDMYADCKTCTQTTNTIDFTPPHCRASEESGRE